jgi:SAM-dependent methyltransferase
MGGAMWKHIKRSRRLRALLSFEETLWTRKVSDTKTRQLVSALNPSNLSALEISGEVWKSFGIGSYQSVNYPAFDICSDALPTRFDLIICEHILEHVLSPGNALRNIHTMLNPQGHLLTVTPFLYKVHPNPNDCARWTEQGMKQLLSEHGFEPVVTGSWGNRACIKATMEKEYRLFNRYLHSLNNEPDYPLVVWALARKN